MSEKAKAKREEQDEEDAARGGGPDQRRPGVRHRARRPDRKAFEDKYGTNHNKHNAFGKCVSQKAHEDAEGEDAGS